jgi:hypothetical protein
VETTYSKELPELFSIPWSRIVEDCQYPIRVSGYIGPISAVPQKLNLILAEATLVSIDSEACLRKFTENGIEMPQMFRKRW